MNMVCSFLHASLFLTILTFLCSQTAQQSKTNILLNSPLAQSVSYSLVLYRFLFHSHIAMLVFAGWHLNTPLSAMNFFSSRQTFRLNLFSS